MKISKLLRLGSLVLFCLLPSACNQSSTPPSKQASEPIKNPVAPSAATQLPKAATSPTASQPKQPQDVPVIDYLTFAQGAIPLSITGAGARQGAKMEQALRLIDGNVTGFTFVNQAIAATDTEFIYALPALTTFTQFMVPNILETPSPAQTFSKDIEIYGSTAGPDGGWVLLASQTLQTHAQKGDVTPITPTHTSPVKWVKVRLVGGINIERDQSFFEFSELVGTGTQETPTLATTFNGQWQGRGVLMELKQDGPSVTGCYDRTGKLNGTVSGNILRATGKNESDGVDSQFILHVGTQGQLRGVRSTNGAPFRLYEGTTAPTGTETGCQNLPPPTVGCGSILHGINFDVNSAIIRPDSEPLLDQLLLGLQQQPQAAIEIIGHTSSEGTEAYNQTLSENRAQSVVEALVKRGLVSEQLTASGKGESEPIATNEDESGRSLNRRVEVKCTAQSKR